MFLDLPTMWGKGGNGKKVGGRGWEEWRREGKRCRKREQRRGMGRGEGRGGGGEQGVTPMKCIVFVCLFFHLNQNTYFCNMDT